MNRRAASTSFVEPGTLLTIAATAPLGAPRPTNRRHAAAGSRNLSPISERI